MTKRRILSCILILTFVQSCTMSTVPSTTGKVNWDNIRYTPIEYDEDTAKSV